MWPNMFWCDRFRHLHAEQTLRGIGLGKAVLGVLFPYNQAILTPQHGVKRASCVMRVFLGPMTGRFFTPLLQAQKVSAVLHVHFR